MALQMQSRARLFQESRPSDSAPKHVPLSIMDATVANFGPSAAVWFYKQPLAIDQLTLSLKKTLNAYPQWTGQLHFTEYNPSLGHIHRQGRLMLSYGTKSDPGIECIIAQAPHRMSFMIPSPNNGIWDASKVSYLELLDTTTTPFALHNLLDYENLPGMIVQLTTFQCGGIAVAIGLAHPLGDAQTLLQFAHDWATTNRALLQKKCPAPLIRLFDPSILDLAAAGSIDASSPDPNLLQKAVSLPLHRYDWWASAAPLGPDPPQVAKIPAQLSHLQIIPSGPIIPWSTWDFSAPVAHHYIYFSAVEVHHLWQQASTLGRISHLDALIAHIWTLLMRARGIEPTEEHHLDISFDLRTRFASPLPKSYIGSPIMMAKATTTGQRGTDNSLAELAMNVRSTVAKFNSDTLPAFLHETAHEIGAQRVWNGFLGRRHAIVTSWLRLGIWDVDFDGSEGVKHVEALLTSVDGLVQVMEMGERKGEGEWYEGGARVSLHLREDAMRMLVDDALLRVGGQ